MNMKEIAGLVKKIKEKTEKLNKHVIEFDIDLDEVVIRTKLGLN